jgi:hypothetical protein
MTPYFQGLKIREDSPFGLASPIAARQAARKLWGMLILRERSLMAQESHTRNG